jgi:hypothetical protein
MSDADVLTSRAQCLLVVDDGPAILAVIREVLVDVGDADLTLGDIGARVAAGTGRCPA